ncbi:phosphate/phosphite/phosphonate ABC transporter substrate-binding protein [Zoogloea sp.]|jgi:phosphonate transport system substrate-binding protein|uniref:phosphate/phosphite/phosphonate ABC transporter substrate-binding protein n=1 Tax=Zoogloea sp. TaxID=49181 RepID=UPI0037D99C1A
MSFNFTVSPSFPNERISDWYIFNTWMQRKLGLPIHLTLHDDFGAQRQAIAAGQVDMIHANPFDASLLVREQGFRAIARPEGSPDEMVIVVAADNPALCIPDLPAGIRIACTDDPCVNTIGRILLEPANLDAGNTRELRRETYIQVAKALLRGDADAGFMPVEAFDGLSSLVRRDLRVLVTSQIQVIHHVFLIGPALLPHAEAITHLLLSMHHTGKEQAMLTALGAKRWQALAQEDVEFMIDILSTLTS